MFFKKTVIFFVVYDVCRKSTVYHTPLFIVDLQPVFPVYEMQVVSGNSLYISCARINNKVRHSIGLNQRPLKSTVRHLLRISGLREQLQNICKKVFRMFGGYAVKQYFCTRFRERNADELKY